MITAKEFLHVVDILGPQAEEDIAWATGLKPPRSALTYAREVIFVICNSGMKNTVARGIYERCIEALREGRPVASVFGHVGKAMAIELVWSGREIMWQNYLDTRPEHRLEYLAGIPWIGPITKYHLAKNFGMQVAKPDVHLQRLADREGCTAQALCERLAGETKLCVAAVDTVLWRACANGIINSRTGAIA